MPWPDNEVACACCAIGKAYTHKLNIQKAATTTTILMTILTFINLSIFLATYRILRGMIPQSRLSPHSIGIGKTY